MAAKVASPNGGKRADSDECNADVESSSGMLEDGEARPRVVADSTSALSLAMRSTIALSSVERRLLSKGVVSASCEDVILFEGLLLLLRSLT
jgi:hypothetical protein